MKRGLRKKELNKDFVGINDFKERTCDIELFSLDQVLAVEAASKYLTGRVFYFDPMEFAEYFGRIFENEKG